ncbi:methyltransferase domain-containing protein [Allomuricauda sp. d1]|uniref:class I SAM-dependent methyltransferase n=1 Tax=Allomuricauda sp. d1 TaxID=3136725 RepID=UPI0031D9E230
MDDPIIKSWNENAEEWISLLSGGGIESRKYTNEAIIEAIKGTEAKKAVDIGCGEGWLTRQMTEMGISAMGIDAIEPLLNNARKKGSETYLQMTFEELIAGKIIEKGPFDLAVYNFCLYKKEGLKELMRQTLKNLSDDGKILIQTLHPYFLIANELPYKSQWLDDAWKGLPGNFVSGHSWYARTIEDWANNLGQIDNVTLRLQEVVNDELKPISIIFTLQKI